MEVSKCWKIVEITKISIKMKNCNTFYEVQKTSRLNEIIQSPPTHLPSDKILLRNFLRRYTEINGHLVLQECSFGRQETVECKCFFWHQTEACLLENFTKLRKVLAVLQDILFSVWVEVRKMSEVFWAKLYCKISDLFR